MGLSSFQPELRQRVRRLRESTQRFFLASLQRDAVVIVGLAALAVAGFVITGVTARAFHQKHQALGREWAAAGQVALREGRPEEAIESLRNALVYAREDRRYRLWLAQALAEADRVEEAQSYLLNLWEREPGDATVNLELARIFAARGQVNESAKYYHNAIHGVWRGDPEQRRRETRLELVEYLLASGARATAQSELMALSAELPQDADLFLRTGRLCLQAQDYARAYEMFTAAARLRPGNAEALRGAGEAAFQRGHYLTAQTQLRRAGPVGEDARADQMLRLATLVLENDPYQRRTSAAERNKRAVRLFHRSLERLEGCLRARGATDGSGEAQTRLQELQTRAQQAAKSATEARLRRDSDGREGILEFAFEMQKAAERDCGGGEALDHALLLIARSREGAEP